MFDDDDDGAYKPSVRSSLGMGGAETGSSYMPTAGRRARKSMLLGPTPTEDSALGGGGGDTFDFFSSAKPSGGGGGLGGGGGGGGGRSQSL